MLLLLAALLGGVISLAPGAFLGLLFLVGADCCFAAFRFVT